MDKLEESPLVLLENYDNKLLFTRGDKRNAPLYRMLRIPSGNWLIEKLPPNGDDAAKAYTKEHFRSIPIEDAPKLIAAGYAATPKIDGAGALLHLTDKGARAFSIRKDKDGNLIEYTDYIPGLRQLQYPKELRDTLIRAELYLRRNGKVQPPQAVAGLLNSTVLNAASGNMKP